MNAFICGGRTKLTPCLGGGNQIYLRRVEDKSQYSYMACGNTTIKPVNLITIGEDIKFTPEEKKDPGLIRAKLYQIRDEADRKPAAKQNILVVVVRCKTCSSRTTDRHDLWNKRQEKNNMSITCPGCKTRNFYRGCHGKFLSNIFESQQKKYLFLLLQPAIL